MRIPVTPLYALPLSVRVGGVFAAPDAPPQVNAVIVEGTDLGPAGLGATVQQCTDDGGTPIVGVYTVLVDTTTLQPGDRVKVLMSATVLGTAVSTESKFSIGGYDPSDYVGHAVSEAVIDPLAALNDSFDDEDLDPSWTVIADTATIIENANGLVFFTPDNTGTGRSWGGAERGPIVYKPVTGDFRVTVDVVITNDAGDALPPLESTRFHMAGLMFLDPRLDQVDAVDCGIGMWNNSYSFQTKNTIADATTLYAANALSGGGTTGIATPEYEIVPSGSPTTLTARLRMCRQGQVFGVHVSYDSGASWAHSRMWDRTANPMAAELYVGPMAYSAFDSPADFQARFPPAGIAYETIGAGFAPGCV